MLFHACLTRHCDCQDHFNYIYSIYVVYAKILYYTFIGAAANVYKNQHDNSQYVVALFVELIPFLFSVHAFHR